MSRYSLVFIALLLIVFAIMQRRKRKTAAIINHRKNHKNEETLKMKELAQKFIGKECMVYTIVSDNSAVNGTVKEVTENGLLIEKNGDLQAVNLEYVTRIREWPRKKNGKKKEIVLD